MISTLNKLIEKYNLWQVVRYGLVGVCAAGSHALMAFGLHHFMQVPPTLSNFLGYISGAFFSYFGSYYFTFQRTEGHKNSLPRFAAVWMIGFAINVGLFKVLLTEFGVPFSVNVFVAIVLTPIVQFLALKFWAFKD